MGRIKEISRKSAHTRKRNPVVYLICEGSETEIRYFKRFRSRGCNIDIIPISSQYKSADRLVQKAKATMGNNPYYPEDGDSIWCVYLNSSPFTRCIMPARCSALAVSNTSTPALNKNVCLSSSMTMMTVMTMILIYRSCSTGVSHKHRHHRQHRH